MSNSYDIVVAGGGHNGLIAAAYLAKAGLSVCVVELQDHAGGGVTTREVTIPGFKHDVCSILHMLVQLNPIIRNDELGLMSKYGLSYIVPEETASVLYPDDRYLVFTRDLDTTCQNIAQFSERDAEAYRNLVNWGTQVLTFLGEGINRPPTPYGASMSMMEQSPEGQELMRLFHMPVMNVLREWFESKEMILALSRSAAESMAHPAHSMGVGVLLGAAFHHSIGFHLPRGGSGALTDALVQCINDLGAEIRLSSSIKAFKLSGDECTGVILESGEEISASKAVVSSLNVMQLPAMVGEDRLPLDFLKKARRLKLSDFMPFHMELALDEPPIYKNTMSLSQRWFVQMVESYDVNDYLDVFDDIVYGIPHVGMPMVICPTIMDSGTRCPEGKHTLYVYEFAPYALKKGGPEAWEDVKEEVIQGLLQTLRERTTNMTEDNILGTWAMSPLDYARYNPSWPNGDFAHFTGNCLTQQGASRPFPGWSNYKTPIRNLYMCGASTHPGMAVSGASRTAMWTIFEELGMDFEDIMG